MVCLVFPSIAVSSEAHKFFASSGKLNFVGTSGQCSAKKLHKNGKLKQL